MHKRSQTRSSKWSHFSFYEVHDNISEREISELEALILHIFHKDHQALPLNTARCNSGLLRVRNNNMKDCASVAPKKKVA